MKITVPLFLTILASDLATVSGFAVFDSTPKPATRAELSSSTRRYNFFKDMLDSAFENDRSLSGDKTKGQYDAPGEEYEDKNSQFAELTETQRQWRERQSSTNTVTTELVTGTSWILDLYLSGVPERDPSNDLYGSRVNISSRDRSTGLDLPESPSASVVVEFLKDGVCRVSESGFTSGEQDGEWKLSEDGSGLRFSLDTLGYTRTVQTKGSIQNVYWTNEEEKTTQTSSTYSIAPGWVYGDAPIALGRQPGTFDLLTGGSTGILRIEKESGLFGISSTMVVCGKFSARPKVSTV